MSKEQQKNKRDKYELLHAMADIRARYPRIRADQIERFSLVYYPIAMVEMLLEEQTFEDFETVQLTVLRLMGMGITDYKVIAATLGLSANYVYKVMHLLSGYGHIAGSELTELGRQSLEKGQKIVTQETLQKFQVDALNGNLLKRHLVVAGNMLNERSETIMMVGHLNYLDGIDETELNGQLTENRCEDFLDQKSGVLHTNVVAIKAARCTELKYAKCCMMKLRGHEYPVVFAKRYNRGEKDLKKRYPWQPLSVHDDRMRSQLGFEENTVISKPTANDYVMQIEQMILGYITSPKMNLQEEIGNALKHFYPLREEGMELRVADPAKVSVVSLREEAFGPYRGELVSMFLGMHQDGAYLLTSQWLQGHVVSFRTKDEKLRYLCRLLSEQIERRGRQAVTRDLKERFRDSDAEAPLVDTMIACLLEHEEAG